MAMQGGHMGMSFMAYGKIGERIISAMKNEPFNAAVKNPKLFTALLEPHYDEITNVFEGHLQKHYAKIQQLVMEKAYDIEILKIHQNVKLLKELPSAYWEAIWATNDKINQTTSNPR